MRRVITDSGFTYRSRRFGSVLRRLRIKHTRTRLYRPQTNGKVGALGPDVLSEYPYLEVSGSGEDRRRAVDRSIAYHDDARPHLGIGGRTPRQRLGERLAA